MAKLSKFTYYLMTLDVLNNSYWYASAEFEDAKLGINSKKNPEFYIERIKKYAKSLKIDCSTFEMAQKDIKENLLNLSDYQKEQLQRNEKQIKNAKKLLNEIKEYLSQYEKSVLNL